MSEEEHYNRYNEKLPLDEVEQFIKTSDSEMVTTTELEEHFGAAGVSIREKLKKARGINHRKVRGQGQLVYTVPSNVGTGFYSYNFDPNWYAVTIIFLLIGIVTFQLSPIVGIVMLSASSIGIKELLKARYKSQWNRLKARTFH